MRIEEARKLMKRHNFVAPGFIPEFRFHALRRWKFDWANPSLKIALEIQGGNFRGGAHARGGHLRKEYEKLNEAQLAGWLVLLVLPEQLKSGLANLLVHRAMESRNLGIRLEP